VWTGDEMVNDHAPRDRDIAMAFQSYALYPHMSVFDNTAFALQQVDTSTNICNKPANTFVASFVGSPSTSLYRARLERSACRSACWC
jgi:ABC-type sugar transport system ATPase subunit